MSNSLTKSLKYCANFDHHGKSSRCDLFFFSWFVLIVWAISFAFWLFILLETQPQFITQIYTDTYPTTATTFCEAITPDDKKDSNPLLSIQSNNDPSYWIYTVDDIPILLGKLNKSLNELIKTEKSNSLLQKPAPQRCSTDLGRIRISGEAKPAYPESFLHSITATAFFIGAIIVNTLICLYGILIICTRRFHDIGSSASWLILLIPFPFLFPISYFLITTLDYSSSKWRYRS